MFDCVSALVSVLPPSRSLELPLHDFQKSKCSAQRDRNERHPITSQVVFLMFGHTCVSSFQNWLNPADWGHFPRVMKSYVPSWQIFSNTCFKRVSEPVSGCAVWGLFRLFISARAFCLNYPYTQSIINSSRIHSQSSSRTPAVLPARAQTR